MKPTKMRNKLIYQATFHTKSKQLTSALSKDLAKKYGKKSVRVIEGDSVKILRGEFKGVDGKISDVSIKRNGVAIEGIKKEKSKGDKFDVYIHTSNLVVVSLDTADKWRIKKLQRGSQTSPSSIADTEDNVQKEAGSDEQKESVTEEQDDAPDMQENTKEDVGDSGSKKSDEQVTSASDAKETKGVDISNVKEVEK